MGEIFPEPSPPNVFIGGDGLTESGFPLKACGNDVIGVIVFLSCARWSLKGWANRGGVVAR
jgi:hypothetical protein